MSYSIRDLENQKAKECLKRGLRSLPLGVADNYRYWGEEETIFVDKLQGGGFTDVDGNEYIDFRLAYGPIILGYRDQRIDDAVIDCIKNRGTISGFNTDLEADVAELISDLCPQVEKVRFANSGTEAVLAAVRTARAFTGRQKVLSVEGGFHGLYDEMMWKSDVENWDASNQEVPQVIPFGEGLQNHSNAQMQLIPLNDITVLKNEFAHSGEDIAAIIIEPIMGNCGSISATSEYMQALRKVCDDHGTLLIMDEVKTGFRVAKGGVQEHYQVFADLTTFAKAIGNGYPIAAFGGRADVMNKIKLGSKGVVHGGTYTGNLVGLSAAKATLSVLKNTPALETVRQAGQKIMALLGEVFTSHQLTYKFSGPAAMFGVHFETNQVPSNYRDWKKTNSDLYTRFSKNLIKLGIMLEPDSREPWFICESHGNINFGVLKEKADLALTEALRAGAN